ncbi:MAG: L-seryl-tRNA(Sec) selenium transferase [Pirellulales bacterium]|nr:L-seryl-tRNA(Sec) selenium transferase [Pirellulales bacterium]
MQREHELDPRRAEKLRALPSVGELLANAALQPLVARLGHPAVVAAARGVLEELRRSILTAPGGTLDPAAVPQLVAARLADAELPRLRPVINATGILLHTGLGRAPLAEVAAEALVQAARDYSSVELDLFSGERSQRVAAVAGLLAELTGAEAALVVNNNAAATMLALAALAAGREVIVSRGELIEIGGSYRLPDVMAASGAVLREVGTTNKTRLADYRDAIGECTAALLAVHTSNYSVVGFTESVPLRELAALARERRLPLLHDLGSGALIDFARFGLHDEPLVTRSLREGADLVLFSGDKLLGGPQSGVLAGRGELIARIARHPMARAVRVDKLTLAALEATLRLYRNPARALSEIPLFQLLGEPLDQLRCRAAQIADTLRRADLAREVTTVDEATYLGGGSIPGQQVPTCCVAVVPRDGHVDALAQRLRTGTPAVVGRINQGRLLLDLRTVFPPQDEALAAAVASGLAPATSNGAERDRP